MKKTKKKKAEELKDLKNGLRDLLKIRTEYEKVVGRSSGLLANLDELVGSYEDAIVDIVMEG